MKDSIGFVSLPCELRFDEPVKENYYKISFDENSSLAKEFSCLGDIYLIGFLPDTTNFLAALFIGISAEANPGVITFDKNGKKIDVKFLTEDRCTHYVGDIIQCKEFAVIHKDLSINYSYTSSIVYEDTNESQDTIYESSEKRGRILQNGKIEL